MLCSTIILPAVILTYLLLTAADSDKAQGYATLEKNTVSAPTTKFPSHNILTKVLIDEAIQAPQNGNRSTTIKYLIAANQEFNSGSENPSSAIEPGFIVEYLIQLMQNGTNSITNNKALRALEVFETTGFAFVPILAKSDDIMERHSLRVAASLAIRDILPLIAKVNLSVPVIRFSNTKNLDCKMFSS